MIFSVLVFILLLTCQDSQIESPQKVSVVLENSSEMSQLMNGQGFFSNNLGQKIQIEQAYLVLWKIKLNQSCGVSDELWTYINAIFVESRAFAHGEAEANASLDPVVLPVFDREITNSGIEIAQLIASSQSFCGATLSFFKADEDTRNLPAGINMLGNSLFISGNFIDRQGESREFKVKSRMNLRPIKYKFLEELVLDNTQESLRLEFMVEKWFDQIQMEEVSTAESQTKLLSNIAESIRVY